MPRRLRLGLCCWLGAVILAGAAGCVERRMVIVTDPCGAVVYDEKNHPIGQAPVDRQFTYYGTYSFRLAKDGYKTLVVEENVKTPWYEWFGLDFISENLLPFTIRDVRTFTYTLQPLEDVPPEQLMQQAEVLRGYGLTKGVPLPPTGPVPPGLPTAPGVLMPPAGGTFAPPNPNPVVAPVPPGVNPPVVPAPPANVPPVVPPPPGVNLPMPNP